MNKSVILYSVILLLSVFISSISQVMLKKAANKQYSNKYEEYLNPLVIFAYGLFFFCTLLTVISYRGIPLSLGPILETTSYFYVTFFGVKIFKEKITKQKIIALFLIVVGILIYALWG